MFKGDDLAWAEAAFGVCELGDQRRTRRLVEVVQALVSGPERSVPEVFRGDEAAREGAYRLLRNPAVGWEHIAEGGFGLTTAEASNYAGTIVAVEDTTSLVYPHDSPDLGEVGGPGNVASGFWVHTVLLLTESTGDVLGLADLCHWLRPREERGKSAQRKSRPYEEKESFKWQAASERVRKRLGTTMSRVVSVCDREADVFEYLQHKVNHNESFVVRQCIDRRVEADTVLSKAIGLMPVLGSLSVHLPQRGGKHARTKRTAVLTLKSGTVVLSGPRRQRGGLKPLQINVVSAVEESPPDSATALNWALLTSEPVDTLEKAQRVVRLYQRRWRIEDFHKAWKSGCLVERRRLQSADNLARLFVMLAFIAVRLLQLRELSQTEPQLPCTRLFTPLAWKCLWLSLNQGPLPDEPPSIAWAYRSLARLGGWSDTKRTGRAGWKALWLGWRSLNEIIRGAELASALGAKM